MNKYLKARINETVKAVNGFSDKLNTASVEMKKAKYNALTNEDLTYSEYITDAELVYLEEPTQENWVKAMNSLNHNYAINLTVEMRV